jgi:hypothetical protein
MTNSSGTILDGESRPEGRGAGTVPRNFPGVLVEVRGANFTFTIAVDVSAAPISSAYFLADVDAGVLDGSSIFRIVREKIAVIQMGLRETNPTIPPVIAHERTGTTGLRHLRGKDADVFEELKHGADPEFDVLRLWSQGRRGGVDI